MRYRQLGKTGLNVSILGFGAASLGEEYGRIDPADGERAVCFAIDHGINYFDVAPYYGGTLAEERLGRALSGKRNAIILASKVGRYKNKEREFFDFSPRGIRNSVEGSLRRLKTDRLDVLQAHDIEFFPADFIIDEAIPAMERLKQEGKIRFIGITAYPLGVLRTVAESGRVDTILSYCRYNLLDRSMNQTLAAFAAERGIGLINASPLHMGALTEKRAPEWHPAPKKVLRAAEKAAQYCAGRGVRIAELALQFALAYDSVATTLVGMSKSEHVQRNLEMLEESVDRDLLNEVLEIMKSGANICWQEGILENFDPGSVPQRS